MILEMERDMAKEMTAMPIESGKTRLNISPSVNGTYGDGILEKVKIFFDIYRAKFSPQQ
jgi:hypothetical protein